MFGNLFGDMEARQKEIKEKLALIKVNAEAGNGAIKVEANGNKEIINISIDKSQVNLEDADELEDLLLVAINRALELAKEKEQAEAQNLIKDMLPPGMGGLGNLFGN